MEIKFYILTEVIIYANVDVRKLKSYAVFLISVEFEGRKLFVDIWIAISGFLALFINRQKLFCKISLKKVWYCSAFTYIRIYI